ncbi:hypothetical protein EB083_03550 [bacterium]|nr:hypothetical protein [Actinomycetota bacterium]NDC99802.1 hypothetical protein [bacterium]
MADQMALFVLLNPYQKDAPKNLACQYHSLTKCKVRRPLRQLHKETQELLDRVAQTNRHPSLRSTAN